MIKFKFGFASLGWDANGSMMSLKLAYNYGLHFLCSLLDTYLKYIQLFYSFSWSYIFIKNRNIFYKYYISIALLAAGGLSNILDRFTYGAVVDYFYWHYGFEFAIFNFADVMINLSICNYNLYANYGSIKREEAKRKSKQI